jgi:hypothetical protein
MMKYGSLAERAERSDPQAIVCYVDLPFREWARSRRAT